MPPALPKTDLRNLAPNDDEVKAARQVLAQASEKDMKSKMGCFTAWLKQNPDQEIQNSKGSARKEWLEKFLVVQNRAKQGYKTLETRKVVQNKDQKFYDLHWWAMETMDKQMGPQKAKSWRESGKLLTRPCPLTGSEEAHLLVYGVPVEWERLSQEDIDHLQFKNYVVGTDQGADMIEQLTHATQSKAGSERDAQQHIKLEPLSEAEAKKQVQEQFLSAVNDKVTRMQASETIEKYTDREKDRYLEIASWIDS